MNCTSKANADSAGCDAPREYALFLTWGHGGVSGQWFRVHSGSDHILTSHTCPLSRHSPPRGRAHGPNWRRGTVQVCWLRKRQGGWTMSERRTRREFMGLTGTAITGAFSGPWLGGASMAAAAAEAGNADLVVFNAKVYTVDSQMPRAEAFAVKASRFIAVGSNGDIKGLIGKDTKTYDARQMTVVPGFTDCHNHAAGRRPAVRSARRQSVRGRVRHASAASSTSFGRRRPRCRLEPGSRGSSSTIRSSRISAS